MIHIEGAFLSVAVVVGLLVVKRILRLLWRGLSADARVRDADMEVQNSRKRILVAEEKARLAEAELGEIRHRHWSDLADAARDLKAAEAKLAESGVKVSALELEVASLRRSRSGMCDWIRPSGYLPFASTSLFPYFPASSISSSSSFPYTNRATCSTCRSSYVVGSVHTCSSPTGWFSITGGIGSTTGNGGSVSLSGGEPSPTPSRESF